MDTKYCKHLRIRGGREYDIEEFIKVLEKQYKFDFKSLPEWKKLIEEMYVVRTQYQNKLKEAERREFEIIETLKKECLKPIELSHRLERAAKKWELLYSKKKKRKVIPSYQDMVISNQELKSDIEYLDEESDVKSTAHPNTEVIQSKDVLVTKSDRDSDLKSISSPQLPVMVCTNQHKKLSAIGSKYSALSPIASKHFLTTTKSDSDKDNIILWHQIKDIIVSPDEIALDINDNNKQILNLSVKNCSTQYLYLRYQSILDPFYFKAFTIAPATPVKLYPGLTIVFKLMFRLKQDMETTEIKSKLCFKFGLNVLFEGKEDILFYVPIVSKTFGENDISVIKTLNIPPTYQWRVSRKCGYPRGLGYIHVMDDNQYDVYVRKRDMSYDFEDSIDSVKVVSPDSESQVLREEDIDRDIQNETLLNEKVTPIDDTANEENVINTSDIVLLLLEDILDLTFQPFVFKHTYLKLLPKCKKIFEVYLTKSDHIGYYNAYYDLEFQNSHTYEVVMTKTIKVFAEILPSPITITPQILDMTHSPITFGFCRDYITIVNNHKELIDHGCNKLSRVGLPVWNEAVRTVIEASRVGHWVSGAPFLLAGLANALLD
ncbi:unnamed protein product [Danaus chrysippus]|uniref:(African queen) hypothetical protein n=1 Tax=Danaus chrysippus TaxID=151541 RepID=A0A8J2QIW1_9NEOP|nr:unnamed protein product [Danaus chrysippus]